MSASDTVRSRLWMWGHEAGSHDDGWNVRKIRDIAEQVDLNIIHVVINVVPMMTDQGMSEAVINRLLVDNPARLLS